jgi:hypothetical protein
MIDETHVCNTDCYRGLKTCPVPNLHNTHDPFCDGSHQHCFDGCADCGGDLIEVRDGFWDCPHNVEMRDAWKRGDGYDNPNHEWIDDP